MTERRDRISIDPRVMAGRPCIKGKRIPVEHILEKLAADIPVEDILRDYPRLTREDVLAALSYAAAATGTEEIVVAESGS